MEPPLDFERFAQLGADIDFSAARDRTLEEAGVSLETWLRAQEWWFGRMLAESLRQRYELTHRYNAARLAYHKTAAARLHQARKSQSAAPHVQSPPTPGFGATPTTEGPRLTLPQYASLRAELVVYPDHVDTIRTRYGFDAASYSLEDAQWQWRFDQDRALFDHYVKLFRHYRDWLLGAAQPDTTNTR